MTECTINEITHKYTQILTQSASTNNRQRTKIKIKMVIPNGKEYYLSGLYHIGVCMSLLQTNNEVK